MTVAEPDKPVTLSEVNCPQCGKAVIWTKAERWRPFCSERCRLIDLGAWFTEDNAIAGSESGDIDQEA